MATPLSRPIRFYLSFLFGMVLATMIMTNDAAAVDDMPLKEMAPTAKLRAGLVSAPAASSASPTRPPSGPQDEASKTLPSRP
jgi:hypothetical protein